METGDLARFLFEIASPERLGILALLSEKPRRHAEVARNLDLTGSEATRHLNRLTNAGLVTKDPSGAYVPTGVGRVLLAGLPFWEYLSQHRTFLLTHDVLAVGGEFVARLGELGRASFTHGTYHVVAVQEDALRTVRERLWVVTEQMFAQAIPILRDKAAAGADVRVIRPRPAVQQELRSSVRIDRNFPVRLVERTEVFLAVLDDQAGVCFPSFDGRVDMATMLLMTDPEGMRWSTDLFLSFWERSQPWLTPPGRTPAEGSRAGVRVRPPPTSGTPAPTERMPRARKVPPRTG